MPTFNPRAQANARVTLMVLSGSVFPVKICNVHSFAAFIRAMWEKAGRCRRCCRMHPAPCSSTRWEAKTTRGLAGLEPVTTELSFQEWMMLSRLLELDLEEAGSSFDHWEMKKNNEVCKACGTTFYPDAKYCHNCGKKRPTLAELQAARSQQHTGFLASRSSEKVPLAAFLDEHGIKQSDHDSLEHVQDMLEMARQKLACDDFTALIEVTDCVLQDDTGNLPIEQYKKFCKATGASEGMMESYKHPMHNFEVESAEPPLLAKSRMGFIVLFDATSASSFEAVKAYLSAHPLIAEGAEKLEKSFPIRFVANKIDMHEQAEDIKANLAAATELCYELGQESEKLIRQISVTDYTGVRELFAELLEECIEEMLGQIQGAVQTVQTLRREWLDSLKQFTLSTSQCKSFSGYLDHATDSALAVAVSQVLWGIFQKRKPAESCWEVVDDGTVVLSQAGRKAIERLRSRPDDLVAKVKEANIQPPLLPSHAGRQGNRENCVTSVQAIVEKCNKEGTKYTDPRFDICADPAKALYVDAHQPGYDCTVAKPAGYKRLTEIIDQPVLFKGGVRPADIIQGQIGTCFFLGALGAMVGEDPDNVRSCFLEHDIDVGVYGIRFFLDGEWYHTIIDDWMPVDQYGRLLYAKSYDHDEVWVPLLEKGFCKMHRCYEMCDGGLPGEAVSLLFGGAMGKFKIKEKTRYKPLAAGVYYETLHEAHEAGWVLSTTFTKSRAAGGKAGQGKCGEGITNDGLVHGHVYSVLRVVEAFGNRLVCCRNPWGQGEWKGKWSDANSFGEWTPEMKEATNYRGGDDGTFWMSIEDFLATSGGVHYSRTIGCKWKMLSQYSYFQTGEMKATALWTYKERADDEIGFWKGDKINVDRIAPGWWTGSTEGTSKSGFFPGNYVKLDDRLVSRFDLDSTEKSDAKDTMTAVVMLIQPLAHRQRRFYKRKQDGLNYKDTSYPRVMLLVVGPDGRAELKKEGKLRELSGEIELRGGHGVWKVYATCMEGGGTPFTVRAYIRDGTASLTEIPGAKLSEISEYV
ncbi:ADL1 [Symbiodinium microadriaticum]|nr:ADL1 [Symbiodinium microadriaticum]